jgi:hypothetical protein
MSGYNMLEQEATCSATTCSNRLQHHAELQLAIFVVSLMSLFHVEVIVVMDCCTGNIA